VSSVLLFLAELLEAGIEGAAGRSK
jgi:hypothetical protein